MKKLVCVLAFMLGFLFTISAENERWLYCGDKNGWNRYLLQQEDPGTTFYTKRNTYYNIGRFSDTMYGNAELQGTMVVEWTYYFNTNSARLIITLGNGETLSYVIPNAKVYFGKYYIEGPYKGEQIWYINQGDTTVFLLQESANIYAIANIRSDVLN